MTLAVSHCTDPIPGVGSIHAHWTITRDPADARLYFVRVRAEGLGALAGARSRAEFTTFRCCTNLDGGCPEPGGTRRLPRPRRLLEDAMMRKERGFSMVELMVAMTITLIVSGAIYGLLTSGSTAFRREPELADRQQNIRVAMDLISRDVYNAGASLPTFSQVFTRVDPAAARAPAPRG